MKINLTEELEKNKTFLEEYSKKVVCYKLIKVENKFDDVYMLYYLSSGKVELVKIDIKGKGLFPIESIIEFLEKEKKLKIKGYLITSEKDRIQELSEVKTKNSYFFIYW